MVGMVGNDGRTHHWLGRELQKDWHSSAVKLVVYSEGRVTYFPVKRVCLSCQQDVWRCGSFPVRHFRALFDLTEGANVGTIGPGVRRTSLTEDEYFIVGESANFRRDRPQSWHVPGVRSNNTNRMSVLCPEKCLAGTLGNGTIPLTLSVPHFFWLSLPKSSAPYWSNPPVLILWHSGTLALSPERQSARMSKN